MLVFPRPVTAFTSGRRKNWTSTGTFCGFLSSDPSGARASLAGGHWLRSFRLEARRTEVLEFREARVFPAAYEGSGSGLESTLAA